MALTLMEVRAVDDPIRRLRKEFPQWRFWTHWIGRASGPDYCEWVGTYENLQLFSAPLILRAGSPELLAEKIRSSCRGG